MLIFICCMQWVLIERVAIPRLCDWAAIRVRHALPCRERSAPGAPFPLAPQHCSLYIDYLPLLIDRGHWQLWLVTLAGGLVSGVPGALVQRLRGGRAQVGNQAPFHRAQCVGHALGRDADTGGCALRETQGAYRVFVHITFIHGAYCGPPTSSWSNLKISKELRMIHWCDFKMWIQLNIP